MQIIKELTVYKKYITKFKEEQNSEKNNIISNKDEHNHNTLTEKLNKKFSDNISSVSSDKLEDKKIKEKMNLNILN